MISFFKLCYKVDQGRFMEPLEILKFPDPRLRQKAKRVKELTPELSQLADEMLKIMYQNNGVGLAAIQVDQPVSLLVADTRPEVEPSENSDRYDSSVLTQKLAVKIKQPLILFNPVVVKKEGSVIYSEGCLSFPTYTAGVQRAEVVYVKARNEKWEEVTIKTDGLLSICLQHEIDHLKGKLFIDHLSPLQASRLRDEIKRKGYPDSTIEDSE